MQGTASGLNGRRGSSLASLLFQSSSEVEVHNHVSQAIDYGDSDNEMLNNSHVECTITLFDANDSRLPLNKGLAPPCSVAHWIQPGTPRKLSASANLPTYLPTSSIEG
jgi:hypothetical protein